MLEQEPARPPCLRSKLNRTTGYRNRLGNLWCNHPCFAEAAFTNSSRGLVLAWRIQCPRRDDSDRPGVSDLLSEMLCDVLNDVEQHSALGNLSSVPTESFVQVCVWHGPDGRLGM